MSLNTLACDIYYKLFQSYKSNVKDLSNWIFLDINGNILTASDLSSCQSGCEIVEKLGYGSHKCSCPDYNQRFHLFDEESGLPLANTEYEITGANGTIKGVTDNDGYTEIYHSNDEEEVTISVFE